MTNHVLTRPMLAAGKCDRTDPHECFLGRHIDLEWSVACTCGFVGLASTERGGVLIGLRHLRDNDLTTDYEGSEE